MTSRPPPLPWLEPGDPFPAVEQAWGIGTPAPGLLAAGGALDVASLVQAYAQGIFPWYSDGQPILWWSTDPRMLLRVADFKLQPSLRKTLRAGLRSGRLKVRFDHDFEAVIRACSGSPRKGQDGTWILPEMIEAYCALHRAGHAHSVETWWDGELAGGLYCINLGRMVFGESMFSRRSNASKIALAALVAACECWDIEAIDCQQNTAHLASLGARELPRQDFLRLVRQQVARPAPAWHFEPLYLSAWLDRRPTSPA
ncbi:leucyl/phenylalanyl-tRNA--protein transferase [Malikia spinosa]|jgi:leucyl/phenylalanyl-tRNA--protein transferase|uniref:leucyl/phenylalanyl-tRNA--protein transferase n=1 Tax=Malikia spinosa TaxID=86180 RepID=UPI003FA264DA